MGWFQRLFPHHDKDKTKAGAKPMDKSKIPVERIGLDGEYDQSGLAKRVAKAFDDDQRLTDNDRIWIAQTGTIVVLKGEARSSQELAQMVEVAMKVDGTQRVDTSNVKIRKAA